MSDERRRRLQRDAARGDPRAAASVLQERLRGGELSRSHLELLAHLDHEPARLALGRSELAPRELREWVWSLAPWGHETVVRALLAAAEAALPEPGPVAGELLAAAGDWCECPCGEHAQRAYEASRSQAEDDPYSRGIAYHVVMAAHLAGHMNGSAARSSLKKMVGITSQAFKAVTTDLQALREAARLTLLTRCLEA